MVVIGFKMARQDNIALGVTASQPWPRNPDPEQKKMTVTAVVVGAPSP